MQRLKTWFEATEPLPVLEPDQVKFEGEPGSASGRVMRWLLADFRARCLWMFPILCLCTAGYAGLSVVGFGALVFLLLTFGARERRVLRIYSNLPVARKTVARYRWVTRVAIGAFAALLCVGTLHCLFWGLEGLSVLLVSALILLGLGSLVSMIEGFCSVMLKRSGLPRQLILFAAYALYIFGCMAAWFLEKDPDGQPSAVSPWFVTGLLFAAVFLAITGYLCAKDCAPPPLRIELKMLRRRALRTLKFRHSWAPRGLAFSLFMWMLKGLFCTCAVAAIAYPVERLSLVPAEIATEWYFVGTWVVVGTAVFFGMACEIRNMCHVFRVLPVSPARLAAHSVLSPCCVLFVSLLPILVAMKTMGVDTYALLSMAGVLLVAKLFITSLILLLGDTLGAILGILIGVPLLLSIVTGSSLSGPSLSKWIFTMNAPVLVLIMAGAAVLTYGLFYLLVPNLSAKKLLTMGKGEGKWL